MLLIQFIFTATGSIYTQAMDVADNQLESGQSIFDDYQNQVIAQSEADLRANGNQEVFHVPPGKQPKNGRKSIKNKGKLAAKKQKSNQGKKTAQGVSGKADNSYIMALYNEELKNTREGVYYWSLNCISITYWLI